MKTNDTEAFGKLTAKASQIKAQSNRPTLRTSRTSAHHYKCT